MLHFPVFFYSKKHREMLEAQGDACAQMEYKLSQDLGTGGQKLSVGFSFLPLKEPLPR
ncbi:MAG: hypothetical protein ACE5IT_04735 [bacterium]